MVRNVVHNFFGSRKLIVVALGLAWLAVLTGCGSGVEEDSASDTTEVSADGDSAAEDSSDADNAESGDDGDGDADADDESTDVTTADGDDDDAGASTSTSSTTSRTAPTSADGEAIPDGSGCDPEGGELPNGEWYGFVDVAFSDALDFDLACRFSGENAAAAQAADGDVVGGDFYVRNDDQNLVEVFVAADAQVEWFPSGPGTADVISYADWVDVRSPDRGVWITVEGGEVTAVSEPAGS